MPILVTVHWQNIWKGLKVQFSFLVPEVKGGPKTPFPHPPPNSSPYSFLFSIHIRTTYSKVQTPLADNKDLQVRLERKAKQGGPPGLQMSMFPLFPFVFRHKNTSLEFVFKDENSQSVAKCTPYWRPCNKLTCNPSRGLETGFRAVPLPSTIFQPSLSPNVNVPLDVLGIKLTR